MGKIALIVNDVVNDIAGAFGDSDTFRVMVSNAQNLVARARSSGVPVIYTRVGYRSDYLDASPVHPALAKRFNILKSGTDGDDFVAEIAPRDDEFVITRCRVSQFYQTRLELILRTLGVDTVIITGCSTDHSVSSFARDASDRDFRVIVVSDGCSPSKPEFQEPALAMIADFFGEVKSAAEVEQEIFARQADQREQL